MYIHTHPLYIYIFIHTIYVCMICMIFHEKNPLNALSPWASRAGLRVPGGPAGAGAERPAGWLGFKKISCKKGKSGLSSKKWDFMHEHWLVGGFNPSVKY